MTARQFRAAWFLTLSLLLSSCGTTLHRDAQGQVQTSTDALSESSDPTLVDGIDPAGGDLGGASGSTAGGASAGRTGAGSGGSSAAPGAADTSPISLGFLTTETGNAAALGVNTGSAISGRAMTEALVKALNAKGGLAGRKINPVIAGTDTASVNWETDFAAACASFTQDNNVAAVLGYAFAFFDSFETCLSKAKVVHLSAGYNTSDVVGLKQYPYYIATASQNFDRYYESTFGAAVATKYMTPANTLGVLRGGCPADTRSWERTGAPTAERLGIKVAIVEVMTCINGASGTGAVISQIQSAVLRFRSRGVDTVMVEGPPIIIFSSAAESQGWRPRYLVSSFSGGAALTGNVTPEQIVNIHGFGWIPSLDVLPPNQPARRPAQTRCMDLLRSQGITPTAHGDINAAYLLCDSVFMYEAALKATNGNSAAAGVISAVNRLGSSYSSAVVHGGRTSFGRRQDPAAEAQVWAWEKGCGCFRYQGQPYGI